jgi:hypothetical protein
MRGVAVNEEKQGKRRVKEKGTAGQFREFGLSGRSVKGTRSRGEGNIRSDKSEM